MCFAGNALNNSFILGGITTSTASAVSGTGDASVATVVKTSTEVLTETIITQQDNDQHTTLEKHTQDSPSGIGLQTTTTVPSQPPNSASSLSPSSVSDSTFNAGHPTIAVTHPLLNTTNNTLYGASGISSTSALCWNANRQTAMPCSKSRSTGYFPGATTLASEGSYTEILSVWWVLICAGVLLVE